MVHVLFALMFLSSPGLAAQDPACASHSYQPPDELSADINAVTAPGGVTVKIQATTLDFWFVKQLAVRGAAEWSAVDEGALIGVVRVAGPYHDIRGRVVKPGVYTLRYGLQPQDGDHLGVSPFREFLLVSPAASDSKASAAGHDGAVELAKLTTGISHPGVMSIDPPAATKGLLEIHTTELGHKAVIVEVPTSAGAPLRFGIVVVGRIEA